MKDKFKIFKIGQTFDTYCWFSGGHHVSKITDRTENKITCNSVNEELDGISNNTEEFDILSDDNGEYIVVQSYKGKENRVYAKDLER